MSVQLRIFFWPSGHPIMVGILLLEQRDQFARFVTGLPKFGENDGILEGRKNMSEAIEEFIKAAIEEMAEPYQDTTRVG
jgi:hypothetical protein